jgi:putative nucleotidyltransferase with HDIG domain
VFASEICRELAPLHRLDPSEAFLAGLLHDIGEMVTFASLEEILSGYKTKISVAKCRTVADAYHVELGLLLAKHWRLPDSVRVAIAEHHRADATRAPIVRLVAAADRVVARIEEGFPVVAVLQDSPFPGTARVLLEALLPTLPKTLQELDPASPRPTVQAEVLERDPTTLHERRPAAFGVTIASKRYEGTCLARDGFEIHGRTPLEEQSVVKATIDGEEPFEVWTVVTLLVRGRERHRLELRPTSMDEATDAKWAAFREASIGAIAAS